MYAVVSLTAYVECSNLSLLYFGDKGSVEKSKGNGPDYN